MKILIIGMGGTGSCLMNALYTNELIIADGDTYEDANLTRQPHAVSGGNKADVMKEVFNKFNTITSHPAMLDGYEEFGELDVIISAVDSNEGRKAAKMLSNSHGCPLIIAQNQEWNPSAWLYLPSLEGSKYDPYITYQLDNIEGQSEHVCEGLRPEKSERGQSGLANLAAAGHAVTILHSLLQEKWQNYVAESNSMPWPRYRKMKDL